MTRLRRSFSLASLAVLALAQPVAAQRGDPNFDGTWRGTLTVAAIHGAAARPAADEVSLTIDLRGRKARVEFGDDAVNPGRGLFAWPFSELPTHRTTGVRIEKHDAAALIYSAGVTGDWILTWQLSLTKTEPDTILVFFWQVLNFKMDASADSKAAFALVGELTRTDRAR